MAVCDLVKSHLAGEGQQESTHSDRVARSRSDVTVRRISGRRLGIRRVKRHRCSFNGHFYNHKASDMFRKLVTHYSILAHFWLFQTDSGVYASVRLCDQRPHQQLYDDGTGYARVAEQVQDWEQPGWVQPLSCPHEWRYVLTQFTCHIVLLFVPEFIFLIFSCIQRDTSWSLMIILWRSEFWKDLVNRSAKCS